MQIFGVVLCVRCNWGRGLGDEEQEGKKAKLFGEEGSNKYIKTFLFPLNYRK